MTEERNSSGAQTHSTPGRLGALRLGLEVGDRGADRGDRDAVERAHAVRLRRGPARPRRGPASATRSRCQLGVAEHRRVRLAALEEEVEVVLPGEADPAVHLDRGVGDAPAGVGGVGLGHRGGQRQRLGLGVGGPGGAVDGRARVLGLEQHLRAAVGDRLVGADRPAELLAVLGVLDRHLHRPLGDPGRLGGERDAERGRRRAGSRPSAGQRVLGGDLDAVEAHRVEAAGQVDRGLRRDGDAVGAALDQVAAAVGGGDEEEVGARGVHHQHLLAVEDDAVAVGLRLHRRSRRSSPGEPASKSAGVPRSSPAASGRR